MNGGLAGVRSPEDCLRQAFDAYNRRDADAVLAMLSDDVSWATDREPLHGKLELRCYWDRQWQRTRTHDHVVHINRIADSRYAVVLEQVVRSIAGDVLSTGRFEYEFILRDRLIEKLVSVAGPSVKHPLDAT